MTTDKTIEEHFRKLLQIIEQLRGPNGCPWDLKQTPQSFKSYLIEESHELAEAIDQNDPQLVCEELGDMFFQIAFLNRLYEEAGHFTMADALTAITSKMIRRHPHVFGDSSIDSLEELRKKWNEIKAQEKNNVSSEDHFLEAVPRSMPALRRAQRVSERAAQTGFEWQDVGEALAKLGEETSELRAAIASENQEAIREEIGDLLFVLVNITRLTATNAEDAMQQATDKFIGRFTSMQEIIQNTGETLSDQDHESLLSLWQQAKNH